MKRSAAMTLGVCSLLLAGLAVGTGAVRAGEKDGDEEHREKIEKRIEVVRFGGGGGFLGVTLEEVEGDARGAEVRTVEPDSAAEKAGVEDGDVIVRFDGVDVRSARQLARLVRETPAGRQVDIEVTRDGARRTLTATLGKGPHLFDAGEGLHRFHVGPGEMVVPDLEDLDIHIAPDMPGPGPHVFRWHSDDDRDFTLAWPPRRARLGIRFVEIGDQLADYFGLTAEEGVLVTSVEADTPAAKAGVKAGDVVLEFDGKPVRDGGQLRKRVREAEGGVPVTMKLHRDGRAVDVEVTLPAPEKPKKIRRHAPGVSL
jgi:serine protease Do